MKFLGKRKRIVHVVRFVKAVSTVIAVLLMIAIAVIASLVAYFWVTGYFKTTSTKISKAIQIQNAYYTGQYLGVYVQNVGQGKATLIANQCLYVGGALRTSASVNPGKLQQISYTLQESDIALVVDAISLNLGQTIKIKIVTSEGTFIEYSFTVNTFQGQNPYSLALFASPPAGGSVAANNDGPYHYGDVVQLTATANSGWAFSGWSGDASGSTNPTSIVINGTNTVTATFTQNEYALTLNVVGGGSVSKLPDQATYHYGDNVQLLAADASGWVFSGWSGDLTGTTNPSSVVIDADPEVTATFTQNEYALTLNVVGGGSVSKLPDQATYHPGDSVQLTATAALGWSFAGWSDDLTGSTNPASLIIDETPLVTATFTQNEYTLTLNVVGSGSVSKIPDQATYHYGDSVQLTATGASGWTFSGWSGDLIGTTNPDSVVIDETPEVTATFVQSEYSISVTVLPSIAAGSVTPDLPLPYHYGDVVTLSESPNPGYTFSGWSGDGVDGPGNTRVVNVTGDMSVTATFTQNQYTLTMYTVGQGSVTPGSGTGYHYGDVVQLTATPVAGWSFQGWSSPPGGSASPASITINGDTVVTATFTAAGFDHFTIAGYPSSVTAGQSFGGVIVTAYDAGNNVVTGYTGQVYFTSTDGAAVLPYTSGSRYTFTSGTGMDNGAHTFLGFTLNTAGSRTITVTDGTKFATTTAITVTSPTNPHYQTSITPTATVASASISYTYRVTRESGSGHNLGWVSIQVPAGFTITSITSSMTSSTGRNWVASYSGNLITAHATSNANALQSSGDYVQIVFTATAPATTGTYGPFTSTVYENYDKTGLGPGTKDGTDPTVTVYVPALDHFTITGYPTSVTAGTSFGSSNVIVRAVDAYGNVVTGYTGSIYFTSTDPQAVLPYTSGSVYTFTSGTGMDNGVHTFAGTGFTLKTAGSRTITVTNGTISATSNTITVNAGSLDHFAITGYPASVTAGQVFGGVTVTAYDAYNNVATGYRGSVYFTSSDGAAVLPYTSGSRYTFGSSDNGVHTFSGFTLNTVGSQTITVTTGTISATSSPITVNPRADHFTITGYPTSLTAGQSFGGVIVTAYDASNNVMTGYTGSVYFTSTDGAAVLPYTSGSRYTFTSGTGMDNGVHTFSGFTLNTAGSQTIAVTDGSISKISDPITVNAHVLVFTGGTSQGLTVGAMSSQITIQRLTSGGSHYTTGTITVNLATTSAGGAFYATSTSTTPITTVTIASGSYSASFYYKDTTVGSPTLTVSSTGYTSATTTFTVYAAGTKLVFTAGAGQTLTRYDVSSVITVQLQDASGTPILATDAVTVSLSSSSSGGRFYSDAGGNNQITSVTIASGASSGNFYYYDSSAGTPTLTASSGSLTPATTTFIINSYYLGFRTGSGQTLLTGQVSSSITVRRYNYDGSSYSSGVITVALTTNSSGGHFSANSDGSGTITSIAIASGSSTSSMFYYVDSTAGTPVLTASSAGYTSATTTFTITGSASQLVFTAGASQSLFTNSVSSVITVQRQDAAGYGVTQGGAIVVSLAKTSTTGSFYANSGGTGGAITQITIASGASSANFYYEDTAAGSSTITASYTGLTSATTTFTITLNQVPNGGFESASNWTTTVTEGYANVQDVDNSIPTYSGYFAELDTTVTVTGTGYASLVNAFGPVAISSIPNTAGSLSIMVLNNGYVSLDGAADGYASIQISVTATDGTQLIYWWGNAPANAPTETATTKVINMGTLPGMFTVGQWVQFSRNLPADWASKGLSSSTSITSIIIRTDGYVSGSNQYGQEIFIDDVQIQ